MSGISGTPQYRRRVAAALDITEGKLDRALVQMERDQAAEGYKSLSHNDRMKTFANIIDVPLTRVAAIDGVSSLLPDPKPMEKRTKRPPKKKAAGTVRSSRSKAPPRKKKVESTVPIRKYAWEMSPQERAAAAAAKQAPPAEPNPAPPVD